MASTNQPVINAANFTESGLDPELRSTVNEVLLSNNCIPQIHATLLHECQASGFVDQVRARALDLLRTGKATTFTECMEQIMAQVRLEGIDADATEGSANGTAKDATKSVEGSEKLNVPRSVVKAGFEVLEAQLDPFLQSNGKEGGAGKAS